MHHILIVHISAILGLSLLSIGCDAINSDLRSGIVDEDDRDSSSGDSNDDEATAAPEDLTGAYLACVFTAPEDGGDFAEAQCGVKTSGDTYYAKPIKDIISNFEVVDRNGDPIAISSLVIDDGIDPEIRIRFQIPSASVTQVASISADLITPDQVEPARISSDLTVKGDVVKAPFELVGVHIMFTSMGTATADGLLTATAPFLCKTEAEQAGLPGTYYPVLATDDGTGFAGALDLQYDVKNIDGDLVISYAGYDDAIVSQTFIAREIAEPKPVDPNWDITTAPTWTIWTGGSFADPAEVLSCGDWSVGAGTTGGGGIFPGSQSSWYAGEISGCEREHHVYCISRPPAGG